MGLLHRGRKVMNYLHHQSLNNFYYNIKELFLKIEKNNKEIENHYYKIIYYYLITKSTSEIFPLKSNFSKNIEKLFNLQFISLLLEGMYLINPKNN